MPRKREKVEPLALLRVEDRLVNPHPLGKRVEISKDGKRNCPDSKRVWAVFFDLDRMKLPFSYFFRSTYGTIYPMLNRMEKEGLITKEIVPQDENILTPIYKGP
ncbi:hypothetical protein C7R92_09760 [Brevibacillus porteri]|uniref:Transcription regulator PadR N-terminal domain-containing protein n=1 Tax=Brevibacillus porteri TaxID=2126350 RepID=A0ABX5FUK2_9BACL|nr:hypothetical protein C7R92_09760 [Brevibacillus porteri]